MYETHPALATIAYALRSIELRDVYGGVDGAAKVLEALEADRFQIVDLDDKHTVVTTRGKIAPGD